MIARIERKRARDRYLGRHFISYVWSWAWAFKFLSFFFFTIHQYRWWALYHSLHVTRLPLSLSLFIYTEIQSSIILDLTKAFVLCVWFSTYRPPLYYILPFLFQIWSCVWCSNEDRCHTDVKVVSPSPVAQAVKAIAKEESTLSSPHSFAEGPKELVNTKYFRIVDDIVLLSILVCIRGIIIQRSLESAKGRCHDHAFTLTVLQAFEKK